MKFVVPLTMPSMRWTPLTIIDSRSTLITGIAAHTLASKRSCTPCASAAPKSSSPCRASSCLLAETTDLPGLEEREHVLAGRLDAAHDLGHDRDRRVVAEAREVGGQEPGGGVGVPARIAHERRGDLDRAARDALDRRGAAVEEAMDGRTDGSVAEEADAGGRHWPRRYRA